MAEQKKQNHHQCHNKEFYFWRDTSGHEIDLLIPNITQFDIFEIKASETINSSQFKGMDFVEKISVDKVASKTLIYGGNDNQIRSNYTVKAWHDCC